MAVKALHHVRFAVKDLDRQEEFASDFGLIVTDRSDDRLVMKTRGGNAYSYGAVKADDNKFIGLAFEVGAEIDLEQAINEHGAEAAESLNLPGGGQAVSMTDADGNQVLLVHGIERGQGEEPYPELMLNTPFRKERLGRNQYARETGPARLWRLGHVGIFVKSFVASSQWYADKIGLIGSDIYHIPGQPPAKIVGFFHLDRGEEYVDHHVLAIMQDECGGCHHISFEVQDFEAQNRTHRFLKRKEYEPIWGVGRHPHCSHVFDVWRSPDRACFETFSDTDLFRKSDGTNIHGISTVVMDEWSDDEPTRYFS